MKHNLLKSVIISVILLMGVSNAWAWNYPVGSVVYFEKPNNWSNAQFMIGHDSYSAAYNMTVITNTKLYQYQHTGTNWNNYGAWAVVDAKDWPAENNKIANRVGGVNNYIWYNEIKKYTLVQSNYAVSNNTSSFTSLLNKTQTITIQNYNTSKKTFEASNNTAGSVTAKYYTFSSSATSVGNQVSTSITNSSSISAAYTSTVTLTASAKSGYQFVGWYDGTTLLSNNTTYSHIVPNSGKTIYARFIKTDAINTPVYLKTGDWKNDNARFAVYAFENTSGFKMWIDMSELDCSGTREYFTCKVPSNTTVILCRLNPDGSDSSNGGNNWTNKWGQTKDLVVGANNYWKFTGWDSNSDGNDEGTWTAYTAPTYTVTLVADSHGTYNVKSGNTTKTSKLSGNVTMSVALNSKITITTNTPEPGYDQSQGAAITIGKNDKQKATLGAEYTICGPTTITGNFVSTEEQVVYLQPTGHWNGNNAQYKAFVFHDTGSKWMTSLMNNVTCETDDQACYTCTLPAGYNSVIFCRVKDNTVNSFSSGNLWNQTNDLAIPVKSENNCYKITAIGSYGEKSSGNWKAFTTPTYPLTLKATPYGEYTVKCNGVSHTSSRTKDIVIDLPVGATVEITKAESYDAAYNNNLVIKTSSNSQYEAAELNTTYTFCGETTIEENFTTTADHVVFLRVETSSDVAAAWNNGGTNNYVYSISNLNRLNDIVGTVTQMTEVTTDNIYKENGYTYYTCIIPQGCSTFRFERKTGQSADATNKTEYFEHLLPLGQSNCFTIEGKNTSLGTFYGDWGLGTADGDYRILYVEQQVAHGTDENAWKTVINTTYQHSSDIIKKGDGATIVSLHIDYDKTKHPEVILQKFTNGEWVDVEGQAHMVLSPLTASADMAMLPGRRNAEGDVNLRYGDGIEEIKADAETNEKAGRVWNFVVQQSGASAYINFTAETFAPYEGNYYIRTDNAAGGWMTYAIPSNVMSRSEYSLEHSGYSHYFCKWVPSDGTPNVKFVVANDYGAAISDTIASDDFTETNGTLEADANVRWMWNEYTNIGSRAYIAGSSVSNFLVAKYAASSTKKFVDKGEWVYEVDLTNVQIDDKLTSIAATYHAQVQELLEKSHVDAGGLVMLASAGNDARVSSYTVRIVYDFKINQTICYLIPTGTAVATSIDVLIERINQDEEGNATQVTAAITPANAEVGLTVYGLITLTKDHITDPNKSEQEALTYWISFPFDVKIGDITGFGEVGKHWMIKYYDGAERAAKGWFLDTKTFWKFFLDTEDVMKANTGYVLTLNKSLLNASNPVYDNTNTLKLYFPSKEKITGEINSDLTETSVTLEPLECKITSPADRTIKDSHWNLIGVPSYAHKNNNNEDVKFFYDYDFHEDKYSAEMNAGPNTFYAMHAYMVQYHGTINWSTFTTAPAQLAAKKNADAEEQYTLRLELQQNGTKADQTFVELHDDATTMFDMNVDLTKMFNAGANIYTLIGSDNQVAANVMPIANTTIPVGVQIATAGEYTFAMPDGTEGMVVELIDYETNTRTNLLLSDYIVNLPAGTCETRFALSVKIDKTATSVENITEVEGANGEGVKKYIIDGKLFLQKNGMLYDAQGHIVR